MSVENGEEVQLGGKTGVVVGRQVTVGGRVEFELGAGKAIALVYQVAEPEVELDGVDVALVEEQEGGQGAGRYVLMVDDAYWGRRVQPARFGEAPFAEAFVMGYRLTGQVRRREVGVAGAPVSFEVTLQTREDGAVRFWDSEEYNALVWSDELQTFVSGPTVTAPVVTDENGVWEYIVPKGHGAAYQRLGDRQDDTEETAAESLRRYAEEVRVAYRGRQVAAREGEPAILNLESARVRVTATPGATVRVGVRDDAGEMYVVPAEGVVELRDLPEGWANVVQFQRVGTGEWDPRYGGQRARVDVREDHTAEADLGALEQYPDDGGVAAGRVYISPGVPAAGAAIVVIDPESGEDRGTVATTNGAGFWSVAIPEEGLGGNLYVRDATWGTVPVYGLPYSDVVLGARAYCGWQQEFKTEAWRRGTWGHANFQWVPEAIWVVDNDTEQVYATEEAPGGGWRTAEPLPKWQYVSDPLELLQYGPQLKSYRLETDHGVEDPSFHLREQPFCGWSTQDGYFRATGVLPGEEDPAGREAEVQRGAGGEREDRGCLAGGGAGGVGVGGSGGSSLKYGAGRPHPLTPSRRTQTCACRGGGIQRGWSAPRGATGCVRTVGVRWRGGGEKRRRGGSAGSARRSSGCRGRRTGGGSDGV